MTCAWSDPRSSPAAFAPGAASRYTDVGHSLLGAVVERVAGVSYEHFVRERVLAPAGMTASRFEDEPLPAGAVPAREYAGPPGRQAPVAPRGYVWGRRASLGLVATAEELYRLLQAVEEQGALPERVRRRMLTPYVTTGGRNLLGYGWEVSESPDGSLVHRRLAGTPGFEGELLHNETDGWDAVILVNSAVGWRYAVWDEIARAVRGAPTRPLEAVVAGRTYRPYAYAGGRAIPVRPVASTP